MEEVWGIALIAVAGFLAGAINAVAGGGSIVSFPALLAAGLPPVAANVTNAVALLPGYASGTLAYRGELVGQRARVVGLGLASVGGALAGSGLLLVSPEDLFQRAVPYLMLASCALLAAQPLLSRLGSRMDDPSGQGRSSRWAGPGQFLSALYGAYFTAGLGIAMLAIMGLFVADDLQRLNALKNVLSLIIGVVTAVCFALFGPVVWGTAAIMAVANFAGGHAGVLLARRMSASTLRASIVAFGFLVAVYLVAR